MLRAVVIVLGVVLLGGAALMAALGKGAAALPMGLFGALLLLGTLFERRRYRAIAEDPPGSGWEATGERFHDPASRTPVEVWFNPATGERRYVRARGVQRPPAA